MNHWIQIGSALVLALQTAVVAAAEPANLRTAALVALNRCSSTRQQQACLEADTALQLFLRQEEGEEQRQRHPRCLGALTQVETVLATFRWRLNTSANLQSVIEAAAQQCPPDSTTIR